MNPCCSSSSVARRLLQQVGKWYVRKKDLWGTAGIFSLGRRRRLADAVVALLRMKEWIPEAGELSRLQQQRGGVEVVVPFFTGIFTSERRVLSSRTSLFSSRTCVDSSELRWLSQQSAGVEASEHQADTALIEDEEEDEEAAMMMMEEDYEEEEHGTSNQGVGHSMDSSRVDSVLKPRLLAPIRDLIAEAVQRGYAKKNAIGLIRATFQPKYSGAEDSIIVNHYSSIIRSIVNYYSFVNQRSSLWKVICIYRKSCALTLAQKHCMGSAEAAFYRFGPQLRISEEGKEVTSLYYPTSLKTTCKFNLRNPRYSEVTILQEPYKKRKQR